MLSYNLGLSPRPTLPSTKDGFLRCYDISSLVGPSTKDGFLRCCDFTNIGVMPSTKDGFLRCCDWNGCVNWRTIFRRQLRTGFLGVAMGSSDGVSQSRRQLRTGFLGVAMPQTILIMPMLRRRQLWTGFLGVVNTPISRQLRTGFLGVSIWPKPVISRQLRTGFLDVAI